VPRLCENSYIENNVENKFVSAAVENKFFSAAFGHTSTESSVFMTRIFTKLSYARGKRWSFHTAKTQSRHCDLKLVRVASLS
jgi:hypothetical protein